MPDQFEKVHFENNVCGEHFCPGLERISLLQSFRSSFLMKFVKTEILKIAAIFRRIFRSPDTAAEVKLRPASGLPGAFAARRIRSPSRLQRERPRVAIPTSAQRRRRVRNAVAPSTISSTPFSTRRSSMTCSTWCQCYLTCFFIVDDEKANILECLSLASLFSLA